MKRNVLIGSLLFAVIALCIWRVGFGTQGISVATPLPGAAVPAKFFVSGTASQDWFYEGALPIYLRHGSQELWSGYATTTSLSGPVTFVVEVDAGTYRGPAEVVFIESDPSVEPQDSASLVSYSLPVVIQ